MASSPSGRSVFQQSQRASRYLALASFLLGSSAMAAELQSKHHGVWIRDKDIAPNAAATLLTFFCEDKNRSSSADCSEEAVAKRRASDIERARRHNLLPPVIRIQRLNAAMVGDRACRWTDTRTNSFSEFTRSKVEWTMTEITCEGYKTIQVHASPLEGRISVDFGGISATYVADDVLRKDTARSERERKERALKDW